MKNGNLFVWMQTTCARDSSRTRASIEKSDIGNSYTVVTDTTTRTFPDDYPALQLWWEEVMLQIAKKAMAAGCEWILKLEDDVLVNRHIVYNVTNWIALKDPYFGVGTLFYPNYWKHEEWAFKRSEHSYGIYKDSLDVEGAQGQVLRADMVDKLIPLTRKARAERGLDKPTDSVSFDWSLSRAAHHLGSETHPGEPFKTFVHKPALVDIHNESLHSVIGATKSNPAEHYWGDEEYSPTWRR